jgi:GT2 family glycosyltransferase
MSSKLTLAIPFLNQLNDAKAPLATFRHNTSEDTEWLIIDNGSTDPIEDFILKFIKPKRMNFIRNESNVGLVKSYQQAYENCTTEFLAITHNDVFVFEKDWDKRVVKLFEEMPDLGGVGFFGSAGCGPVGERIQDVKYSGQMAGLSNMLEAEVHGMRLDKEWEYVSIFDGFMMIFRMEMLKKVGGFDQRYKYHHIYDRDASLESLRQGYKNIVVNVPCHHLSGLTANRSDYQDWIKKLQGREDGDMFTHDENSKIFREKFDSVLPLYVESDGTFRTGTQGQWNFKGDAIKKL